MWLPTKHYLSFSLKERLWVRRQFYPVLLAFVLLYDIKGYEVGIRVSRRISVSRWPSSLGTCVLFLMSRHSIRVWLEYIGRIQTWWIKKMSLFSCLTSQSEDTRRDLINLIQDFREKQIEPHLRNDCEMAHYCPFTVGVWVVKCVGSGP